MPILVCLPFSFSMGGVSDPYLGGRGHTEGHGEHYGSAQDNRAYTAGQVEVTDGSESLEELYESMTF